MLSKLLRHGPPWVVATTRGLLEAAALAALVGAAGFVASADAPAELQLYAPLLLAALRVLEGLADQIDPTKARRVP